MSEPAMRSARYENNLLRSLELAAGVDGKRLLFVPPEVNSRDRLTDLVLREQRGYRETELAVTRRRIEDLEQQRRRILEHCPYERDLHTGERFPVAPELGSLEYRLKEFRREAAGHQRALESLGIPETRGQVAALLDRFELRPNSEWKQSQTAGGEGILIDLVTYGYGLLDNPEERLEARRYAIGLPPDRDWD